MGVCEFKGCVKKVLAKKLCGSHYNQQWRGENLRPVTRQFHEQTKTRLYGCWRDMKQRCYNTKNSSFKDYGERGIGVCDEWLDNYVVFRDWALSSGYTEGLSIERLDNDGPYSPENCGWKTAKEQSWNRRTTRYIEAFGEIRAMCEWLDDPRCVVNKSAFVNRLNRGMDPELALTTEPRKGRRILLGLM